MISSQGTLKHVPQRTCIACRTTRNKRELIRLVCTADGTAEADPGGKKVGRGAYLCRRVECWEAGLKGSRLEHALKTQINRDSKEHLLAWIKDYLGGSENTEQ